MTDRDPAMQIAFLERFVEQLNEVVVDQQKTIDQLTTRLDKLQQTVQTVKSALQTESTDRDPLDEKPPHY